MTNGGYPPQQPPGGPMQYPPQGGYPPPGYGQAPKTNGMAIASLVLGILWICGIGSILALIFGLVARNQIQESQGQQQGQGLAIAGIVLGAIGVALLVLGLIFDFVTFTSDF